MSGPRTSGDRQRQRPAAAFGVAASAQEWDSQHDLFEPEWHQGEGSGGISGGCGSAATAWSADRRAVSNARIQLPPSVVLQQLKTATSHSQSKHAVQGRDLWLRLLVACLDWLCFCTGLQAALHCLQYCGSRKR